jgi:hypothetical protein
MKRKVLRGVVEVGFIILLFYSNLLMGEFTKTGPGNEHGLLWAMSNIFTATNFAIAITAAFAGYAIFEALRKQI